MKKDDTQFTLSLKEYLDDKFKVISQRIDSLSSSIDTLIRDTNHTKDRVSTLEVGQKNIQDDIAAFKKTVRGHMKLVIVAFLLGTMIWVPQSREFIFNILQKLAGL